MPSGCVHPNAIATSPRTKRRAGLPRGVATTETAPGLQCLGCSGANDTPCCWWPGDYKVIQSLGWHPVTIHVLLLPVSPFKHIQTNAFRLIRMCQQARQEEGKDETVVHPQKMEWFPTIDCPICRARVTCTLRQSNHTHTPHFHQ